MKLTVNVARNTCLYHVSSCIICLVCFDKNILIFLFKVYLSRYETYREIVSLNHIIHSTIQLMDGFLYDLVALLMTYRLLTYIYSLLSIIRSYFYPVTCYLDKIFRLPNLYFTAHCLLKIKIDEKMKLKIHKQRIISFDFTQLKMRLRG